MRYYLEETINYISTGHIEVGYLVGILYLKTKKPELLIANKKYAIGYDLRKLNLIISKFTNSKKKSYSYRIIIKE